MHCFSFRRNLKRNVRYLLFLLLLFGFFLSCNENREGKPRRIIDLNAGKADKKQIKLSEVADSISYIKLQTPDSFYLSNSLTVKFTDNYLVIIDRTTQGVYLFSRNGKLIRTISSIGGGPAEYLYVADCLADEKSQSIYILDPQKGTVLVFDFQGRYKRYFTIKGFPHKVFLYANRLLFITPSEGKGMNEFPHIFTTDFQGKVLEELRFPTQYQQNRFANSSSYIFKDTLVFWQETSDTIFNIMPDLKTSVRGVIVDNELMPKKILMGKERSNNYINYLTVDAIVETNGFFFFDCLYKRQGLTFVHNKMNHRNFDLIYHYDVKDHGFFNDIDGGPPFSPNRQMNEKFLYSIMSTGMLLKTYNHPYTKAIQPINKLQHQAVDSLIRTYQVEDNPIIQIIYFK